VPRKRAKRLDCARTVASPGKHGLFALIVDISFEPRGYIPGLPFASSAPRSFPLFHLAYFVLE
jgi:hypothetical protein